MVVIRGGALTTVVFGLVFEVRYAIEIVLNICLFGRCKINEQKSVTAKQYH